MRQAVLLIDFLERVGADDGVGLHDDALFRRQLAGLEQDVVGQADLADVV